MKRSQVKKIKNVGMKVFAMALVAIMLLGVLAGTLIYIMN